MKSLGLKRKLRSSFWVITSGIGAFGVISFLKNDEKFYKNFVMPVVQILDPEDSHKLAIFVSKHRLFPKPNYVDPDSLKITLFNKTFKNPIGIAAGFDKHAEAILGLRDLGFGLIEIGSVTPEPQPGNPKPRVFRLKEDLAVINRYGFNSDGHDIVSERLSKLQNLKCDGIVGVNLGKNKNSPDAINDYVKGVQKLGPFCDYLVINVSSPNTPGLRLLQEKQFLKGLLKSVITARDQLQGCQPPILLKLAPDLSEEQLQSVANVIQEKETRIDGIIISNTTIQRPEFLKNTLKNESGGLSGKPLRDHSTEIISLMYRLTKGQIPIIGVGGVFTGEDAYNKIKAGASVVQIYTSFVYEGPPVVTKIKRELAALLSRDGYRNLTEVVGRDVK